MKRKAVFLDRDGVINRTIFWKGKLRAPMTLADFAYFDGVKEAVADLKAQDFLMIVVTNQPDVARGWQTREMVEQLNQKVKNDLAIDAVQVCFHVDSDGCECRKPKPGMLREAALQYNIDLTQSFMVGDRYSDLVAGNTAGCQSILVGPGDEEGKSLPDSQPATRVESLSAAAAWILNSSKKT